MSADEIASCGAQHSVRQTTSGKTAVVICANDAFVIGQAANTPTNKQFVASCMEKILRGVHGSAVNGRILKRGVSTALGATGLNADDGCFYIATPYHQTDQPVACVWVFREQSPYRNRPRVYIRNIWIEPDYRRIRLAKAFLEAVVALFCCKEKDIEIRALLPMQPNTLSSAWEATATSLGLRSAGTRILLEP